MLLGVSNICNKLQWCCSKLSFPINPLFGNKVWILVHVF